MLRRLNIGRVLLVLVPFLTIGPAAQAVVTYNRVFVATGGNDAGVCANPVTPCSTFAGAMAQVQPEGEVIVVTSGGFGAINITQSVTISAAPGIVAFTGYTANVNAAGATVVLRGLTIDGAGTTGNGINVTAVAVLRVESCVITGFVPDGVGANGHGLTFNSPGQLFVKDALIRGNANVGISVGPTSGIAQATVDHCRLEQNHWGLISGGSTGTARTTIRSSVASGNANHGLYALGGGELNAEGCLVANNGVGLVSIGTGSTLRASNCTVTDNITGLEANLGGSLLSRSNNTVEGNTFDDGSFTGTYSAK